MRVNTSAVIVFGRSSVYLFLLLILIGTAGCGILSRYNETESCNFRTYANARLTEYLRSRYDSAQPARIAILPFEVPETFADQWDNRTDFGIELARRFQAELFRTGEFGIIELFSRDRWPGKTDDFFNGNYQAIQYARDAGYNLVIAGFVERPTNADDLNLATKIIDTSNNVTVWYGVTQVSSWARDRLKFEDRIGIAKNRPENFYFQERVQYLAKCTVDEMLNGTAVP